MQVGRIGLVGDRPVRPDRPQIKVPRSVVKHRAEGPRTNVPALTRAPAPCPKGDSCTRLRELTVRVGTRLKVWKMKPIRSRRTLVSWRSFKAVSSMSPRKTLPELSVSRRARVCSRVDLPEPDGPMIAV